MTAQAVRGIPRWLLLALCLIYASVGFLGRVPFKPVELSQMGWMLMESSTTLPLWQQESLFHGLLRPMALSQLSQALPVGLSSETLFMLLKVSAWLILLSVLALTWLASKGFALATAAQPVSFAFGGEAQPNDYALSMADSALLALVAALGFSQFAHEFSPYVIQLLCVTAFLCALSITSGRGWLRLLSRLLPLLGLASFGAPVLAALLAIGHALQTVTSRSAGRRHREIQLHLILALIVMAFVIALARQDLQWQWFQSQPHGPVALIRHLAWFTWPIWPLVIWTLWKWRQHWLNANGSVHLQAPIVLALITLAHAQWMGHDDRWFLLALPPLAVLAAFALPTLTRSVSSIIDWFTLLLFSGSGLLIWLMWVAGLTQWPASLHTQLQRLLPGFELALSELQLLTALLATSAWLWLFAWRTGRHRASVWKSLALPAGGAAMCWILLMTLWLPYLNQTRGLEQLGQQLRQMPASASCAYAWNLNRAQVSALHYYLRPLQLVPITQMHAQTQCEWLFANRKALMGNEAAVDGQVWQRSLTLTGSGAGDDDLIWYQRPH